MIEISLILPDIRSTHNVGSIFRTAEIFGVKHIYIAGYTPYPKLPNDKRLPHLIEKLSKQINKTALGTEKIVPFSYFETAEEAIARAKKDGNKIMALEQAHDSQALNKLKISGQVAIILGSEVLGVKKSLLSQAEKIIEIPQLGNKESLNVSNACAILLYDICIIKNTNA